jgi:hypothetical protein
MKAIRNVTLLSLSLLALALLAVAPAAYADTVTYTATVSDQLTDLNAVIPTGLLPEYNPALYPSTTLTGVTISILGNGATTFDSIYNFGASSTEFIGTQNTSLWLTDPANSGINALLDPLTASIVGSSPGTVSHGSVTGGLSVNSGQTLTDPPTAMGPYTLNGALATLNITDPASMALFVGSGDLDFLMTTGSNFQLTTNGADDLTTTITTDAGATITVTYQNTPILTPEPGTLTLFGTGLLGLAGMLRRKFMQSR